MFESLSFEPFFESCAKRLAHLQHSGLGEIWVDDGARSIRAALMQAGRESPQFDIGQRESRFSTGERCGFAEVESHSDDPPPKVLYTPSTCSME
jgi:hypothetical protein